MQSFIIDALRGWRASLTAKTFTICFAAVHLPLIALVAYLAFVPAEPLPVLVVTLIATLAGAVLAYAFIQRLTRPLGLLLSALRDYRHDATVPVVAAAGPDEIGRLGEELTSLIAQLETTLGRLRRQAYSDPLTGLGNRRWLMEAAGAEVTRARRENQPLSIVAFDLDHFKRINDCFGHDAGDAVLVAIAEAAQSHLRPYDMLARIGGEEFCAVLPRASQDVALAVADRIRTAVAEAEIPPLSRGAVTASFGVYEAKPGCDTLKAMIVAADQCLYAAKDGGRNRVSTAPRNTEQASEEYRAELGASAGRLGSNKASAPAG